jgi:hypothetical protein
VKRFFALASITLAFLTLTAVVGCTNWERQTYQALAASQATINQAQADYESGALPHSTKVYNAINEAKAFQTTAVQAMVVYEQLKATNAGADALTKAENAVGAALAVLPSAISDIKVLYTDTKAITGGK